MSTPKEESRPIKPDQESPQIQTGLIVESQTLLILDIPPATEITVLRYDDEQPSK